MQAGNVEFDLSTAQDDVLLSHLCDKSPADLPSLQLGAYTSSTLGSPLRRVDTCPQLTAHTASQLFGSSSTHASACQVNPTVSTPRIEREAEWPFACSPLEQVRSAVQWFTFSPPSQS